MALPPQDTSPLSQSADTDWAVEIFHKHFAAGLEEISDPVFLGQRYHEFVRNEDPIYATLFRGMSDESLARTFVSYWTIAQTMATQSRFWLEDAITEVLIRQVLAKRRPAIKVLSQSMLGRGRLEETRSIAEIGEEELELIGDRTPWHPLIQRGALSEIAASVDEQERERVHKSSNGARRRAWTEINHVELIRRDHEHLERVVAALKGPPAEEIAVQCNLLVVEPNQQGKELHAWAFRFVNPKSVANHATRKQERVNMLRLYALLVQEKILREPVTIHVGVAELLPRTVKFEDRDRFPDYFSAQTYWSSERLWKFIGVPFAVVSTAIEHAAKEFREKLIAGLRDLLPSPVAGSASNIPAAAAVRAEPSLFPSNLDEFVRIAGVDRDLLMEWRAIGLLSFDPRTLREFEDHHVAEVRVIRSVMDSALPPEAARRLLEALPKPYLYDPLRLVYNFYTQSWQSLPGQSEEEIAEQVRRELADVMPEEQIDEIAEQGDVDRLIGLLARITAGVERARRLEQPD